MRRRFLLLAGTAFFAAFTATTALSPKGARAFASVVFNPTQEMQDWLEFGREAVRHVRTAGWWLQQAQQMKSQIDQLIYQTEALTRARSVEELGRLAMAEIEGSYGAPSHQIADMFDGVTQHNEAARFIRRNTIYEPDEGDEAAEGLRRRTVSLANMQAELLRGYQRTEERRSGFQRLVDSISGTPDMQATAVLANAHRTTQMSLQQDEAAYKRAEALMRQQEATERLRAEARGRRDADAYYRATESAWGRM